MPLLIYVSHYPPYSLLTAATDHLQSRGSQRRLHSDSADHVLVLHAQHPTCLCYATGLPFRRDRRRDRYDRGFPLRLGPSELVEHGRRNGHHGLDVRLSFHDRNKLLRLDI